MTKKVKVVLVVLTAVIIINVLTLSNEPLSPVACTICGKKRA
jgi:hypothetical protein